MNILMKIMMKNAMSMMIEYQILLFFTGNKLTIT